MEKVKFLIVLSILCQNSITAKETPQNSRLIFDLTRPVNNLIVGNISEKEFLSDVSSAFSLIGASMKNSTIFYSTGSGTIHEMEQRTLSACKIIIETLERCPDATLLISWTVTADELNELSSESSSNKTFAGYKPVIILNLHDKTNIDGLTMDSIRKWQKLLTWHSSKGMFAGNGFNESLLGSELIETWGYLASIIVVNMKFGTTSGVTESFGLLKIRMKSLSEKMLDFSWGPYGRKGQIVYYPVPNSVGDDDHQNLLIQYASLWTASNKTVGSMLLQVPSSRKATSTKTEFSIIPALEYSRVLYFRLFSWPTLFFTSSFNRQQSVFMETSVWEFWNRLLKNKSDLNSPTDIVLDNSNILCERSNSLIEKIGTVGQPSTVLYRINSSLCLQGPFKDSNYVYNHTLQVEIVKRISSDFNIGCVIEEKTFKEMNMSDVAAAISGCQEINGNLYILRTTVLLEWYKDLGEYSFHFENIIREELHAVNWFRNGILERIPSSQVYLELSLKETGRSTSHYHKPYLESNALFCDELEAGVNCYFEGIVNWAKLENFPIIFKVMFEVYPARFLGTWFSLLRRLNNPYKEWSLEDTTNKYQFNITKGPSFMMQDYLQSSYNWTMDTCIEWTESRWELVDSFFHSAQIGTVFHPEGILKHQNQTIDEDEYSTMLQFIFYRFRLVEISIPWDFRKLLASIGQSMVAPNTKIFMHYILPVVNPHRDVPVFESFLAVLKKNPILYETSLFKGVHLELAEKNAPNLATVLKMLLLVKQTTDLKAGIFMNSVDICNRILERYVSKSSSAYRELVGTANYIVCKETDKYLSQPNSKTQWQSMLDSHLAIKRILHRMVPHLEVYFRVELDFEIGENNATLDRYTSLVALFKTFGTAYNISYFIVDAFDSQLKSRNNNGWWGIKNFTHLNNPKSYFEKVSVLRGQPMWYPPSSTPSSSWVPERQDSKLFIIGLSVSSAIVLLLSLLGVCFGLRYRKLRHLRKFLTDSEVQEFLNGRVTATTDSSNMEMELLGDVAQTKFNQTFKLNLSDITIDFESVLGSGTFGTVFKGLVKNIPAAIKRPNQDCSKITFKSVLAEVKVLSYIGNHPNVVGFLGAYVNEIDNGVLYIATELCTGGSLEAFLRKKVKVIPQDSFNQENGAEAGESALHYYDLNAFAIEIAQGMEYIESKRVVHGDLSARNVLLDENLVCKIGDFGLSRKLYEYQKYVKTSQEPLPWKWMANESLAKMEFTSKSDIWSYGVTLWEIYSLGKIPYGGLNWSVGFANDLQNGLRLEIPDFALEEIYIKMMECWNLIPDERPSFADMVTFFRRFNEDAYTILDSTI